MGDLDTYFAYHAREQRNIGNKVSKYVVIFKYVTIK